MPNKIITSQELIRLSNLYKIFSSETRLKIIYTLSNGELCVNHLADKLNISQSAISHQLKDMRQNGIVKCVKNGQTILYSLQDKHIMNILNIGISHIKGENCHE